MKRFVLTLLMAAAVLAASVVSVTAGAHAANEPWRWTDGVSVSRTQALACLQLDMFVVLDEGVSPRCFWGWNGGAFWYDPGQKSPDNPSSDGATVDGADISTRVDYGWTSTNIFSEWGNNCLSSGYRSIFRYHVGLGWGEVYCVPMTAPVVAPPGPGPAPEPAPEPAPTPAYRQADGTTVTVSDALACLTDNMFVTIDEVRSGTRYRCWWGYNGHPFSYDNAAKSAANPSHNGDGLDDGHVVHWHRDHINGSNFAQTSIFDRMSSCVRDGNMAVLRLHNGWGWGELWCVDKKLPTSIEGIGITRDGTRLTVTWEVNPEVRADTCETNSFDVLLENLSFWIPPQECSGIPETAWEFTVDGTEWGTNNRWRVSVWAYSDECGTDSPRTVYTTVAP